MWFAAGVPAAAANWPICSYGIQVSHLVYYLDGSYEGMDLLSADYCSNSTGTLTVTNLYAGIYRSNKNPGTTMTWHDAWVFNYNGSLAFYVTWARNDCGLSCNWEQKIWSGSRTVQAKSHWAVMQHGIYWGCCHGYSAPSRALYWP
jgi:hypothetical protein